MRPIAIAGTLLLALAGLTVGQKVFAKMTADTIASAAAKIESAASGRLADALSDAGARRPFGELALVVSKADRTLDLWVLPGGAESFTHLKTYPVLAASGTPGPKLREGDRQVPEGVYGVRSLNPNSRFHLSLEVDYPSAFDLARAREDGRSEPGSNIFIHGGAKSVGCVAIGDAAIEEVFLLCSETPLSKITVLIAPSDPSKPLVRNGAGDLPSWMEQKDAELLRELERVGAR